VIVALPRGERTQVSGEAVEGHRAEGADLRKNAGLARNGTHSRSPHSLCHGAHRGWD